ncbi:PKD domain-containing protein [Geodermatophilus sp. SYSU D00691]
MSLGQPHALRPASRAAVALAVVAAALIAAPAPPARADALTATLVRTVETGNWAVPSPDPAGITYLPSTGQLLVSDSEVDEMPLYTGTNLFLAGRDGAQAAEVGGTTVPWSHEPAGVSYDEARGVLYVSDDDLDLVFRVQPGADGRFGTADDSQTSFSTRPFRNGDAEDVAVEVDALGNGHLMVVDGHDKAVYDWGPGPNGAFDALAPNGDDTVTGFDLSRYGAMDPEGLVVHPTRGTILVLDSGSGTVYEVSRNGALVNAISIAAADPKSAAGITLAPPSDGSGGLNLYVVDRRVDNNTNSSERDGLLHELAVALPPLPGNLAPYVYAGADRDVRMPSAAGLSGAVTDDGRPTGATPTAAWSVVSGPGEVTFADPAAASTTATFSVAGDYVLRLTGSDGELQATDDVTVKVTAFPPGVLEVPVTAGSDDAEERSASVSLTGTDLELVTDGSTVQKVGLRFTGVALPPRATVTNAYVQFTVDEATSTATALAIGGQAADDAPTFTTASKNVSSRPRTAASIAWAPPAWPTLGAHGAEQRTPNLAPVLREIVNRPGWVSGNAVVLVVTGSGARTAAAFERGAGRAPVLHIEYGSPSDTNTAPVVDARQDVEVTMPHEASLAGLVVDDGLPLGSDVGAEWSKISGPGDVTFDDTTAEATTATFSAPGAYVLRLTADDGELQASDDVTVTVNPPPPGVQDVPVASGTDDAEERSASVSLTGTDLELVADGTTVQTVGLRFAGVAVPPGATITAAYVQFSVDEATSSATALTIGGQAADAAPAFANVSKNISSRPRTTATVAWTPAAWPTVGARGTDQRTPDLTAVLQEIVSRSGWQSGNPVVLVVTGSGTRTAAAFERGTARAPVLHVEWSG